MGIERPPPPTPSPPMRVLLISVAMLHVLVATGEAYGWTALRPVLNNSGYFDIYPDFERTTKLTLVSTLGISANAMCKLPLGFLLDRCGPRFTSCVGSVFFLAGALLMGLGDRQSVAQIGLGYFLLGTSGPFIQMPSFQFTNLFPRHKATLISLMITAFELSTGVFFLFNVGNSVLGITATQLFTGYAAVGVFTLLTSLAMWPDSPHVEPRIEANDRGDNGSHQDSGGVVESLKEEEENVHNTPIRPGVVPLMERGFWGQATPPLPPSFLLPPAP